MVQARYTPMIEQYLKLKEAHEDAILFFRLGDFYEMFFADAILASKVLEIQLTARDGGPSERIPMCGVPHHSAETYIKRLIDKGYKVAIGEQVEEATPGKKLVDRQIVRLITPGTHIEDEHAADVHCASLAVSEHFYALAVLNLSTGVTQALKIPRDEALLINEMSTLQIREVITPTVFQETALLQAFEHHRISHSRHDGREIESFFESLLDSLPTEFEQKNAARLIDYIKTTQKRTLLHLKPFHVIKMTNIMRLDGNTIRHLEILKTMRQNQTHGSLFWLLNQTQTALGSRYLKQQLLRPLMDKTVLNQRYEAITALNTEFLLRDELKTLLTQVYDLERLAGRISYGHATARDLKQLERSLKILPLLKETLHLLKVTLTSDIAEKIHILDDVVNLLERAIEEEPPLSTKEGGMIKRGYDADLDELKDLALGAQDWLNALEESERERTGIKKLKIGYNRVFGYFIEVPKSQVAAVKDELGYTRKQTLANAERFINPALKEKERSILSAEEKSLHLESRLFSDIVKNLKDSIQAIQQNAQTVAYSDFLLALALVSEQHQWQRPVLHEDATLSIKQSVHPVVATLLKGQSFIPNDVEMNGSTDILLITGPNMSGKSTYMRQVALIAILAQIGSFVPAQEATLPLFDQVFTRIGASDDLSSGQSTFMVEMLEAHFALSKATKNSLILFDEIGRGTSTYDGLALAWAMLEHIHHSIGAKTLFSTHYHELVSLEEQLNRLKNIHVTATEKNGTIHFHHAVAEGPSDRSYGIQVAALAGLPKKLIQRASQLLHRFEKDHQNSTQPTLFDAVEWHVEETATNHWLEEALDTLDLDSLKPIDALNVMYEWRKKRKEKS